MTASPISPDALQLYNGGCRALQTGRYSLAAAYFRGASRLAPAWAEPQYNLACALQADGNVEGAIQALRSGHVAHPEDSDMASNLASLLVEAGLYEEGAALFAELAQRHPDEQKYLENRAFASSRARTSEAAAEAGMGFVRILLACMPKSGSTYLSDLLAALPLMHRAHLVPNYGRREQVLAVEQLAQYRRINYVSQLHLKPSSVTHELVRAFGLRPVVLTRNLWDVMASLRDHMYGGLFDWSMAQVDSAFLQWDEARQYDFLARAMMPWFIDFHVSWFRVPDKLALRYETLIAEPAATLAHVAEWAHLPASAQDVATAIAKVGRSRTFNKGGSGRGQAVPEAARAHVRALASYYPDVDFTSVLD